MLKLIDGTELTEEAKEAFKKEHNEKPTLRKVGLFFIKL